MWAFLRAAIYRLLVPITGEVAKMPESLVGPVPKLQAKQDAWNQWAEFIGVWSLIAAFLVCPWVGGAALAETGEFAPVAAGRLWRLSLCLLFVSTLTFALSFEHKIGRGESARQALGGNCE